MVQAGGRLFVDVAPDLASPVRRNILVNVLGNSDPLIKGALVTILERGDFIKSLPDDGQEPGPRSGYQGPPPPNYQTLNQYDPAIVAELMQHSQTAIEALKQNIQRTSGAALLDFVREDLEQLRKSRVVPL